jgi:hypothetical protein
MEKPAMKLFLYLIAMLVFTVFTMPIASGAAPVFLECQPAAVMTNKSIIKEDITMSSSNNNLFRLDATRASPATPLEDLLFRLSITQSPGAAASSPVNASSNDLNEQNLLNMSCSEMVRTLKIAMEFDNDQARSTGKANWSRIAEWVYKWFKNRGAKFLTTPMGELFMYYRTQAIPMKKNNIDFNSLLFKNMKIPINSKELKTVAGTFFHLAYVGSSPLGQRSWLHTDVMPPAVYLHLNNDMDEIVRITPDGVTVMMNGNNPDGVFLLRSQKIEPIHYDNTVSIDEGMNLLRKHVTGNLALPSYNADFLALWFMAFPLMDFAADTKPHSRYQGGVGSGKTTASKLISTVIFGHPQQKIGTMASNYCDASTNPMVILDNIETHNVDKGIIDFILTASTNIARERRKPGMLNENIIEYTKTLINTTGIEPLGAHLSEIMTRSFIFEFDQSRFGTDYFSEAQTIEAIRNNRDIILSALFKKVSVALTLIRDGYQKKTVQLLKKTFGRYSKSRCNEYISLMYLMRHADDAIGSSRFLDFRFSHIDPEFERMVSCQEWINRQLVIDSHAISCCLDGLFKEYTRFYKDYMLRNGDDPRAFKKDYGVMFSTRPRGDHYLDSVDAKELHNAFKKIAAKNGLEYQYKYPSQLGQRIRSDQDIISQAGFDIQFGANRNYKQYTITVKPDSANSIMMEEEAVPTFDFHDSSRKQG